MEKNQEDIQDTRPTESENIPGEIGKFKELIIGAGARALRICQDGIWIGAEKFANALWGVDMDGISKGTKIFAYASISQTFGGGSEQVVFDTEEYDFNNEFAGNTFTAKVAGYYNIKAQVSFANGSSGENIIMIKKNTSIIHLSSSVFVEGVYQTFTIVGDAYLDVGDTISIYFEFMGSDLGSDSGRNSTNLCIHQI